MKLLTRTLACMIGAHSLAAQAPDNSSVARTLSRFSAAIEEVARASSPAVVQISVRGRALVDSGQVGFVAEQKATGSGVIVDPNGYIVTNAHVVSDARHIDVSVAERGSKSSASTHRHYSGEDRRC